MPADLPVILAVLAAVAAVFAGLRYWHPGRQRARYVREGTVFLAGYFAYFGVRGLTEGDLAVAQEHARLIVAFERAVGLWVEPALQAMILDRGSLVTLANWIYIWGHWPVIAGVGVWLVVRHPAHYPSYRNAFLISGGIGLAIFVIMPVMPPRLIGEGLVDTVAAHSEAYRVLQPPQLTNQYAAFPSLHFGWNLLIGIALFETSRRGLVRVFAVVMPLAMLAAIVLTANHYVVDAAGGGAVALTGFAIARYVRIRRPPAQTPGDATGGGPTRESALIRHPAVLSA